MLTCGSSSHRGLLHGSTALNSTINNIAILNGVGRGAVGKAAQP